MGQSEGGVGLSFVCFCITSLEGVGLIRAEEIGFRSIGGRFLVVHIEGL